MTTIVRAVLAAGVLLLAARASAEESVTHQLARKHYEIGKSYYDIANYTQALDEFKKAYELQPLPALLFNMGRCHEGLGDLQQAIIQYKLYLTRQPDADNRSVVELRIKNLERRLARQRRAPTPALQPAQPPPAPTPPPVNLQPVPSGPGEGETVHVSVRQPPRWKRIAGWSAVGLGGASLVTGIALGALVRSKSREYQDGVAAGKTYFELSSIASSGRSYQKGEVALLVVGSVVAAAGVGLVIWDALGGRESRASSSAGVVPFFSGSSVGLCGSTRF